DQGLGLYAAYEASVLPVTVAICPNRLLAQSHGHLAVTIPGSARLDVRAIDARSLRILTARPKGALYDHGVGPLRPGPLLGRMSLGSCSGGRPDRFLDLVVKFDTAEVASAIERALGRPLRDGDVVALTL